MTDPLPDPSAETWPEPNPLDDHELPPPEPPPAPARPAPVPAKKFPRPVLWIALGGMGFFGLMVFSTSPLAGWLLGWLRGEAFYRGWPSRCWRVNLAHELRPSLGKERDWAGALARLVPALQDHLPAKGPPPTQVLPHDPAAIPVVRDLTEASDVRVRAWALEVLYQFQPTADATTARLRAGLEDPYAQVRLTAARLLWRRDHHAAAVLPIVEGVLNDHDVDVRFWALPLMQELGPAADPVLPGLRPYLTAKSAPLRTRAAIVLAALGPAGAPLFHAALGQLPREPGQPTTGAEAEAEAALIEALGAMGPAAADAAPWLTGALQVPAKADAAARALGRIVPGHREALAHVRRELQADTLEQRLEALATLALFGPSAQEALGDVDALLRDGDPGLRLAAARATWKIARARVALVLPVLRSALAEGDREAAAATLADLGPAAREAVPDLTAQLDPADPSPAVIRALGGVGPAAAPAVPRLLEAWRRAPTLRPELASALKQIDPAAAPPADGYAEPWPPALRIGLPAGVLAAAGGLGLGGWRRRHRRAPAPADR